MPTCSISLAGKPRLLTGRKKALAAGAEIERYAETLSKMKKSEPTWPDANQ